LPPVTPPSTGATLILGWAQRKGDPMRLSVRFGVATAVVVAVLGVAAPAYAINDPVVPGDDCSPNSSAAVGDPVGGNPGIALVPFVNPPVSLNNPGESTGAKGQERFRANAAGPALAHCDSPR
jgi:hypothetical protein